MSEQFEQKLRDGVEAARIGDKVRARLLLQQVLSESPDNELALMWMASVSESVDDRKYFLQRALNANPQNDRAREALNRLGVAQAPPVRVTGGTARNDANTPRRPPKGVEGYVPNLRPVERRSGLNGYLLAAGALTVVILVVAGITLASQALAPLTAPSALELTFAAVSLPTRTSTPLPTAGPTATLYGRIVTLDPNNINLPPTFTPTVPPTATDTPPPTPTPLPLGEYNLLYSAQSQGSLTQRLFSLAGDAANGVEIGDGAAFEDIALSADGERLAFVRVAEAPEGVPDEEAATLEPSDTPTEVSPETTVEPTIAPPPTIQPTLDPQNAPQLYTAARDDLGDATALTQMRGETLSHPSWSPDGDSIVFANDEDGDLELYRISAEGSSPTRLTDNDAADDMPSFSPDGAFLVYASDEGSPGLTEIHTLQLEDNVIARLTDAGGSAFNPVYSPDGAHIAFVSDRSGDNDIYVIDADGSGAILLTVDDDGAQDRSPAWSPDGRFIAFASNREDGVFAWYLVEYGGMPTGSVTRLAADEGINPDAILFISTTP